MLISSRVRASAIVVLLLLTASITTGATPEKTKPTSPFKGLEWRLVGPFRGGRVAAVEGIPSLPMVYYFGGTGGGVWKTTDGGTSWKNVSDSFFGGSIGAVAVSPSDPNVVYAGGGEKTVRGNVSHGDGIWKSLDAGKSWTHSGLEDSRHIPRIRIHPRNPDLVYAAVLGHLFGPNEMRGIYRSKDGARTWERILFVNRDAGAVDLILDPTNPRTLYATTWRVRRTPYSLESGGEGSGLWKSTDGGDSWKEITRNKGLPKKGPIGISGITVSPSNPENIYAIVESEEGGVFRSRDGGETWEKTSDSRDLRQRAWYYTRIYADPREEDTVYVLNVRFHRSKDGGKTFSNVSTPHSDNHDLWIDPADPQRMIEGNDGGANVSFDGGKTWSTQENQPTAQFYRVTTDNDFPYRLLGAQQDNSAIRIRHRSFRPGISVRDWDETAGSESGHIVAKPDDPDLVMGGSYGGYLTMLNHRTGEFRDVNAWPDNPMGAGAADLTHRFQWNFPIFFSPHDPNTLYAASQYLSRTRNSGVGWERISPDLTRNDKTKMGPSGGPITKDNTSVEYYGTIFAAVESRHEPGVLWAGSDDGLIHLSRDNGRNWTSVRPAGMPDWIMINSLEVSPFEPGGLYVAGTMYKSDDFRPYLYKTSDYGRTWTKITNGIPADQFTRVIRADPHRKGLVYAGTERGVFVSFDDGANWQPLQLNLPITPITDLAVKENDLIAATQGRSFWILDDVTPLHQWSSEIAAKLIHLFTPETAQRLQVETSRRPPENQGTNPPNGVVVDYLLKDPKPDAKVKLAFLTEDGKLIRELTGEVKTEAQKEAEKKAEEEKKAAAAKEKSAEKDKPASETGIRSEGGEAEKLGASEEKEKTPEEKKKEEENKLPDSSPGLNRFAWNLRYPDAKKFEGLILWGGGTDGPRAIPGRYQVRLTVGDQTVTAPFEISPDPRSKASQADLKTQFDFLLGVREKLSEIHQQIENIREVRKQISDLSKRLEAEPRHKPIVDAGKALDKKMTAIEEALYQTKNKSSQDPLNYPIRLNDKLASLSDSVGTGDFGPTEQAIAVRQQLLSAIDAEMAKLKQIWETDLPAFNRLVREQAIDAVVLKKD